MTITAEPSSAVLDSRTWSRLLTSIVDVSPYFERFALDLVRLALPHLSEEARPVGEDLARRMGEYVAGRTGPHLRLNITAQEVREAHPSDPLLQGAANACLLFVERSCATLAAELGAPAVLRLVLERVHDHPAGSPGIPFAVEHLLAGGDHHRVLVGALLFTGAYRDGYPISRPFRASVERYVSSGTGATDMSLVSRLSEAPEAADIFSLTESQEEVLYSLLFDGTSPLKAGNLASSLG